MSPLEHTLSKEISRKFELTEYDTEFLVRKILSNSHLTSQLNDILVEAKIIFGDELSKERRKYETDFAQLERDMEVMKRMAKLFDSDSTKE